MFHAVLPGSGKRSAMTEQVKSQGNLCRDTVLQVHAFDHVARQVGVNTCLAGQFRTCHLETSAAPTWYRDCLLGVLLKVYHSGEQLYMNLGLCISSHRSQRDAGRSIASHYRL